jgi:hypothetical protein
MRTPTPPPHPLARCPYTPLLHTTPTAPLRYFPYHAYKELIALDICVAGVPQGSRNDAEPAPKVARPPAYLARLMSIIALPAPLLETHLDRLMALQRYKSLMDAHDKHLARFEDMVCVGTGQRNASGQLHVLGSRKCTLEGSVCLPLCLLALGRSRPYWVGPPQHPALSLVVMARATGMWVRGECLPSSYVMLALVTAPTHARAISYEHTTHRFPV